MTTKKTCLNFLCRFSAIYSAEKQRFAYLLNGGGNSPLSNNLRNIVYKIIPDRMRFSRPVGVSLLYTLIMSMVTLASCEKVIIIPEQDHAVRSVADTLTSDTCALDVVIEGATWKGDVNL